MTQLRQYTDFAWGAEKNTKILSGDSSRPRQDSKRVPPG